MTSCRYHPGRQVPITLEPLRAAVPLQQGQFHLLLIQSGSVRGQLPDLACFIGGRTLLCLSPHTQFVLKEARRLSGLHLAFAPAFINVHLHADTLLSPAYEPLRRECGYPDLHLFQQADPARPGIVGLDDTSYEYIAGCFDKIAVQLREQPDSKWSCRARYLLLKLIAFLCDDEEVSGRIPAGDTPASRMCQYILTHLDGDLTVGTLCRKFATNHTSLYRQFKAHTGLPVSEYVLQKRLETAKSSLAFTSLSLAEIARTCGFKESSYFARIFKQHTGMTPLMYRCTMRKKRMD